MIVNKAHKGWRITETPNLCCTKMCQIGHNSKPWLKGAFLDTTSLQASKLWPIHYSSYQLRQKLLTSSCTILAVQRKSTFCPVSKALTRSRAIHTAHTTHTCNCNCNCNWNYKQDTQGVEAYPCPNTPLSTLKTLETQTKQTKPNISVQASTSR